MPLKAPDRNRDRDPASTPLPDTSTTTRSSLSSPERLATMKSPANEVPPADFATDSTSHCGGSSGRLPCFEMRSRRSTKIDSPNGPETPSRLRRNEVNMISRAMAKVTAARVSVLWLTTCWLISSTQKHVQTKTMNQGNDRGPSQRLPMNIGSNSTVEGTNSGEMIPKSVPVTVSSTRKTSEGRSEIVISRRKRSDKPRQGAVRRFANVVSAFVW